VVIVAASEIMVKGGARRRLEHLLERNVALALRGRDVKVYRREARVIVEAGPAEDVGFLAERIAKIPGVRWTRIGYIMPRDYELLVRTAVEVAHTLRPSSIAVRAVRSDKSYPKTSLDIMRELGELVRESTGAYVDLKRPDALFWVAVLRDSFLFSWIRFEGVGGLPIGSSGRVLALFSGGIDSPVAAWLMMKRGCVVDLLHIYAFRSPQEALSEKINGLFSMIRWTSPSSRLLLAPYHYFLEHSVGARRGLELALFRRFMFRLGEAVASRVGAKALVTGDSLSQVASQTIESLQAATYGLGIPVLQPLIGFDKEEIISLSKRLGFYGESIRGYKDCCSIVSRDPITRPRLADVLSEWERLRLDEALRETLGEVYVFDGESISPWKDISVGEAGIGEE